MINKIYVFIFFGEFGYELFNWQGKVKKFYETLGEGEIIVCAGRRGLDIIYPYAKYYQDLSDLEFFRTSHSCVYWMIPRNCKGSRGEDCTCSTCHEGREEIKSFILDKLQTFLDTNIKEDLIRFVFSDKNNILNGINFGKAYGRIYNGFPFETNSYTKLKSSIPLSDFTQKNNMSVIRGNDYVLCQSGFRPSHGDKLDDNTLNLYVKFINEILKNTNVVFIDFETGMEDDSKSSGYELSSRIKSNLNKFYRWLSKAIRFESPNKFYRVNCNGLREQVLLIENSKFCVFFTIGDLRSHTYIPPLVGKDVKVVHSDDVVGKAGVKAVNYWNQNVFRFGGQMSLHNQNSLDTKTISQW